MAIRSQISAIVANQLGRLEGEVQAKIITQANDLVSRFTNQCPNKNELLQIVKVRNNLLKVVNNFQKTSNRFNSLSSRLSPAIAAARVVIRLLENNPIPSAIIPPSGGIGVSLGKIVKLSDKLRQFKELLEALEDDVNSINSLVNNVNPSLENIRSILESVNINIQSCAEELGNTPNTQQLQDLVKSVQPLENTGTEGTPDELFTYRSVNGKDYTLVIIEDRGIEASIPRRVAVAKDNLGVIVLRGQPSFSSDTQVLLDELKFRIDNQLL